ncbi:MAG: TetR/AcrR family transcriptional regulator, partial [Alphaproteobacteria bacterium]
AEKIDWRARRGAATREQILDAAVRTLVKRGYSDLTTTTIAKTAGVSRGAMLHHFPAKDVLIREMVRYLFDRRMAAFEKMVATVSRDGNRVAESLKTYWQQVNHPYFIAFFELTVAARTDKMLHAMLAPCQDALDARGLELAQALFPQVARERLTIGLALSQAVVEYLALQHMRRAPNALDDRLIAHLSHHIRAFYGLDAHFNERRP